MKRLSMLAACLGVLMAALALVGCKSASPSQYTSPRVEGRVLDAQTHEPIEGVRVQRVVPGQDPSVDQAPVGAEALEQAPAVRTGQDGTFVLDSQRDLELFRRTGWFAVTLSFKHDGYALLATNYTVANATTTPSGEPLVKAGNILLKRLSR